MKQGIKYWKNVWPLRSVSKQKDVGVYNKNVRMAHENLRMEMMGFCRIDRCHQNIFMKCLKHSESLGSAHEVFNLQWTCECGVIQKHVFHSDHQLSEHYSLNISSLSH